MAHLGGVITMIAEATNLWARVLLVQSPHDTTVNYVQKHLDGKWKIYSLESDVCAFYDCLNLIF